MRSEGDDRHLSEVLNTLWRNWAFRLSLASNELFHSNILQFLAEMHAGDVAAAPESALLKNRDLSSAPVLPDDALAPQAITACAAKALLGLLAGDMSAHPEVLLRLTRQTVLSVRREWNDMDLVVLEHESGSISAPGRPLFALEVKIKSFPKEQQLVGYSTRLNACWPEGFRPPFFLLTGMGSHVAESIDGHRVKTVTFKEIADRLGNWCSDSEVPAVLGEYIRLCTALDSLFQTLQRILGKALTVREVEAVAAKLGPFRLHTIWWKQWASFLEHQCRDQITKQHWEEGLYSYNDFTQVGVVGVCWRWPSNRDPKTDHAQELNIGIQIQGRSVRLFVHVKDNALGDSETARQIVERTLLRLCATKGIFATNPRIRDYLEWWSTSQKDYSNRTELAATQSIATADAKLFTLSVGWGRKGTWFVPRLHGYANALGDGFADFRLTLADDVTIEDMASMVKGVVLDGLFSSGERTSPLHAVVAEYGRDPTAWLQTYGLQR